MMMILTMIIITITMIIIFGGNSSNLISELQLGREFHGDIRWLDGVALVGLELVGQ